MYRVKSTLRTVGLGALGFLLMLGLWIVGQHLWQDHLNLHGLVNIELQREQREQGPAPAVAPAQPPPAKH